MAPRTVDEVIEKLDEIVVSARRQRARWGYFASLYKRMTVAMKTGIEGTRFSDPDRVAAVDVAFAERYFVAFETWRTGGEPLKTWRTAFDATQRRRYLVFQHLLGGMNAHINVDLGISTAQVLGPDLPTFEADFLEINRVIAEQIDDVQARINQISPWFGLVDRIGRGRDEALFNFSVVQARAWAWSVARDLSALPTDEWPAKVARVDHSIDKLALGIIQPGPVLSLVSLVAKLAEEDDVPSVLDVLDA